MLSQETIPNAKPTSTDIRATWASQHEGKHRPFMIPANPPRWRNQSQAHWDLLSGRSDITKNPSALEPRQCELQCSGFTNSCCAGNSTCCPPSSTSNIPCCPAQEFCWAATCCIQGSEQGCGPGCMTTGGDCCDTQGYWCDPGFTCQAGVAFGSQNFCLQTGVDSSLSLASLASISSTASFYSTSALVATSLGSVAQSVLSSQSVVSVRSQSGILPAATSQVNSQSSSDHSSTPVRVIVGGVIGGVFALAGLAIVILFLIRELKNRNSNKNNLQPPPAMSSRGLPTPSPSFSGTGTGSGTPIRYLQQPLPASRPTSLHMPGSMRSSGTAQSSPSLSSPVMLHQQNPWVSPPQGPRPVSGISFGSYSMGQSYSPSPGMNPNPPQLVSNISYYGRDRDSST